MHLAIKNVQNLCLSHKLDRLDRLGGLGYAPEVMVLLPRECRSNVRLDVVATARLRTDLDAQEVVSCGISQTHKICDQHTSNGCAVHWVG